MAVIFDKLAYVRRLEQDGKFDRVQAKALSEALHDAVRENVAAELDALRQDARQNRKAYKELSYEVARLTTEARFRELKLWIAGSILAGGLILCGLIFGITYDLVSRLGSKGVAP